MTKVDPCILSQAWPHCRSPFCMDTYTGCDFGCSYCFVGFKKRNWQTPVPTPISFSKIKRMLTREGLEPDKGQWQKFYWAWRNITYKLGVRCDPFPYEEKEYKNTFKTVQLFSDKHLLILTKNPGGITDEYLDQGANLAVGVSITSPDGRLEARTPSYESRIAAIQNLSKKGIPVHLRLTPTKASYWTDYQLEKLFDNPFYTVCYSNNCTGDPDDDKTEKIMGVESRDNENRFKDKVTEIACKKGISTRYQDPVHKLKGAFSCLPDGFPYWKGTFWDKIPEIPKEAIMYPRADGILVKKLKETGMSYIHMNHILHLYAKGRIEFAGLDENWDKKGVNLYDADSVNFPKVLF